MFEEICRNPKAGVFHCWGHVKVYIFMDCVYAKYIAVLYTGKYFRFHNILNCL